MAAVFCFSLQAPAMFYFRSYPKHDDDDDAKELVFLDGQSWLIYGVPSMLLL